MTDHRLQPVEKRGIVAEIEYTEVEAGTVEHIDAEAGVFPPSTVRVIY